MAPIQIRPRESVILVEAYDEQIAWYERALGFVVRRRFDGAYRFCNLESPSGIAIGIVPAAEMGVTPGDRAGNTVVLQFEVDDVPSFMAAIEASGGSVVFGPSLDKHDGYWYGAIADPEGNQMWVVDKNCP